jgi:hypothetical protein
MVTKPKKRNWRTWMAFLVLVLVVVIASEIVQNFVH